MCIAPLRSAWAEYLNIIEYLQDFVNVHENLVYVDDDNILEKNNLNTLLKKDFSLTINYKNSHFSKPKRYYSGEDIIEWTSGLVDDEGLNIQEPETFKYELALEYPILGSNPLQLHKINNILGVHPDLDPKNILNSALAAGGLVGVVGGTGMSILFWLLSNMGNKSLANFIKVLPSILIINGGLYFNKNNNNFIVNDKNEFELHEKYTSLIDWKLQTNEITTYNEKVNIIGSIGLVLWIQSII